MAAHVFPLTVKFLLAGEGHDTLTDGDVAACLPTDLLNVSPQWVEDRDGRETGHSWQELIQKTTNDLPWQRISDKVKKEHSEVFEGEPSAEAAKKE
jgi:hypothetical protein